LANPGLSIKQQLEEKARLAREARVKQVEQDKRAREAREQAEKDRERKAKAALEELKVKWAKANQYVDELRAQKFVRAGEIVTGWKDRRTGAIDRCHLADSLHSKKMSDQWHKKEEKFLKWQEEEEEKRQERARQLAAKQSGAKALFQQELALRDDRLEEAQRKAEVRRLAKAEEKRIQREEARQEAERRLEESWQARLRVMKEREKRCSEVEAECDRKAAQAEACLAKRRAEIQGREDAWRTAMQEEAKASFTIR